MHTHKHRHKKKHAHLSWKITRLLYCTATILVPDYVALHMHTEHTTSTVHAHTDNGVVHAAFYGLVSS